MGLKHTFYHITFSAIKVGLNVLLLVWICNVFYAQTNLKYGYLNVENGLSQNSVSDVKFIMLTIFDDDDKIFEAIKSGAVGYLLKDENPEKLIQSIKEVVELGGAPMSPRIARKTLQLMTGGNSIKKKDHHDNPLSQREMEILKKLIDGKDYKKIAEDLFLSPFTVRTHITNIYKKIHVNNKTQAINLVNKKGWFNLF